VHAGRLKELAADAVAAAERQDVIAELTAWRASLDLLPAGSRQYTTIAARVADLSRTSDLATRERQQPPSGRWKWLAALGPAGLLLWKFKFLIVAIASKAKLLILGLSKASTFTSMLLAFGVYWAQWGCGLRAVSCSAFTCMRWGTSRRSAGTASRRARRCSFRVSVRSSG
jgi:hypothetical protein